MDLIKTFLATSDQRMHQLMDPIKVFTGPYKICVFVTVKGCTIREAISDLEMYKLKEMSATRSHRLQSNISLEDYRNHITLR